MVKIIPRRETDIKKSQGTLTHYPLTFTAILLAKTYVKAIEFHVD